MKKELFVLILLLIVTSIISTGCGGAAPVATAAPAATEAPSTQAPAATEAPTQAATQAPVTNPPAPVAILVLDDFTDEVSDVHNPPGQYKKILEDKKINITDTSGKNCIYTLDGQAATISTGAAATISTGAGSPPFSLPAPHGVLTYEELHSVIKRVLDQSTNAPANTEAQVTDGMSEFGLDWIKTVIYFTNLETNQSIALIAVDTSDYTTNTVTDHLSQTINALVNKKGYSRFVINMSFVIMPCPNVDNSIQTFDQYQALLNDPQLAYLKDYIHSITDPNGNITFSDRNDKAILVKLAAPDASGNQFLDQDGNSISTQDAGLILEFDADFGRLRLRSHYNLPKYDPDKFHQTYEPVLNDPIRSYMRDQLIKAYPVIPVAAAGNDGLPYPYAPAMWNDVLSVSAPIDGQDENGLQVSTFVDGTGQKSQFKTNSGEVVAEGCTHYDAGQPKPLQNIPGTSFSAPKVSYLAALYLLRGRMVTSCAAQPGITPLITYPPGSNPVTVLGYAQEDGTWANMSIKDASVQYCSSFPFDIDPQQSCQ